MYLASHTDRYIFFSNLLARLAHAQLGDIDRVKQIFRYLQGIKNMGLFFPNKSKTELIGFADAGFMSDPHNGKSQTGYVFTYGGTAISWRLMKQTIAATSSNHAEILAIHEASRECVWLRSMIQHKRNNCGLSSEKETTTVLFEDNTTYIDQLDSGYIKGDRTKHIAPKFFFTHDL
ncbi:secreted RxLR effector protein 161-like [Gossypium arboreum]|uniref:secreted RxLR effector protein 161-like n=1 Tax=Gossypium arboreum TaxID=29729 RepID=UPI0022F15E00|nr:secreted RxLR effector protein 161-like [Gossypium arboreum]